MRVLAVMAGELRTLAMPSVLDSIQRHVLIPLAADLVAVYHTQHVPAGANDNNHDGAVSRYIHRVGGESQACGSNDNERALWSLRPVVAWSSHPRIIIRPTTFG